MLRTLTALIAMLSVCSAAAIADSGVAAASTTGKLTAIEYSHLNKAFTGLDTALSSKTVDWGKADAACGAIGSTTPLLRSERSSCLASVATYRVLFKFDADQSRCESKPGKKATAAKATVDGLQLVVCLDADYQKLGHVAATLYASSAASNREVQARGFSGKCFSLLGEPASALRNMEDFATSSKQLAADVTVMIRINNGKAPSSSLTDKQVQSDVKVFETAAKKVLSQSSSGKISDCPHA